MGFCFGGHLTYLAALRQPIAAAASSTAAAFARSASPGNDRSTRRRPHVQHPRAASSAALWRERTAAIPKEQAAAIKEALAAANVRHEVVAYPRVGHGFFCDERA